MQDILLQNTTSFERLATTPDDLNVYLRNLEDTVKGLPYRRKHSWMKIAVTPRQASIEQYQMPRQLDQAVQNLRVSLDTAMFTATTFTTMVKAGADLEKLSRSPESQHAKLRLLRISYLERLGNSY